MAVFIPQSSSSYTSPLPINKFVTIVYSSPLNTLPHKKLAPKPTARMTPKHKRNLKRKIKEPKYEKKRGNQVRLEELMPA